MARILIVNGPNINMIGSREPGIYGSENMAQLNARIQSFAAKEGVEIEIQQSNHEGEIIEIIQNSTGIGAEIILINPAAYTHTSIAIRDALLSVGLPVIEIHISNIYRREAFRHKSMISGIAVGVISGFGTDSYLLALKAATNILSQKQKQAAIASKIGL